MGAWGVKATECDYGLDLLDGDVIGHLQKSDFHHFNVKEIKELLTKHIIDEIRYANRGCSEKLMDYFIKATFPYRYDIAALLIAECLTDYFTNGELVLDIYERNTASYQRKVSEFLYTSDDLRWLLDDLKALFDPERDTFQSWEDSPSFPEWREHVTSLCNILKKHL